MLACGIHEGFREGIPDPNVSRHPGGDEESASWVGDGGGVESNIYTVYIHIYIYNII